MVLNGSYQFIGRSSAVKAYVDDYYYYVLLYAKTIGSTETGKHRVSIKMRLACNVNSTFYGYLTTAYAKVDGADAIAWSRERIPSTKWPEGSITEGGVTYARYTDLREGYVDIDTKYLQKDVTITASWQRLDIGSTPPNWLPSTTVATVPSIVVTLPMIPSASTINYAGDVTLGNACSVKWTPKSTAFYYKMDFQIGDWKHSTEVVHPNQTTEYTYTGFTIPLEVANQITKAPPYGTMYVYLHTFIDSAGTIQIGNTASAPFKVNVPDNEFTKPTVVEMTLTPVHSLPAKFSGLYIKGRSKVKATISAKGWYGAAVEEITFTVNGKTYKNGDTSDYLSGEGTLTVTANVKDSRGFVNTDSTNITVYNYEKPSLLVTVCERSDDAGNISDKGTSLRIEAQRSIFPVGGYNSGRMWYQWKLTTAPDSGFSDEITLTDKDSYSGTITNIVFNTQASYVIRIGVTDDVGETTDSVFTILTEKIYWHRGDDFLALGMYTQNGGFECGWPARFYAQVYIGNVTLETYIKNIISGGG